VDDQKRDALDVLLVTSAFPVPSEAFATVEANALRCAGVHLRVRGMRAPHALRDKLLRANGVENLDVTHASFDAYLRGLGFMLRHPWRTLRAAAWTIRHGWRTPGLTLRCLLLFPRLLDIFRECMRHPPDVLHLYWGHYPSVVGYLAKRYLPEVHLSVCLYAFDLIYAFGPGLVLSEEADTLWTLAECNVQQIRDLGVRNPRLLVQFHGVDLSEVPPVSRLAEKCRGKVVTIARLVKNKGVDDALRVFAVALARHPEMRLSVIGEGEERAALEQLARELKVDHAVTFMGAQVHSVVYDELAAADVMLLMTKNPSERLPNAVKEAMACRCICVMAASPGIEELTGALENQCIVPMGDCEGGAKHLLDVVENPARYERDRDEGRAFVLRAFDALTIARRRIDIWNKRRSAATTGS
jgi:glycosyltransferase involved in cell wall biosynthesis